jgi:hypothetical protein
VPDDSPKGGSKQGPLTQRPSLPPRPRGDWLGMQSLFGDGSSNFIVTPLEWVARLALGSLH